MNRAFSFATGPLLAIALVPFPLSGSEPRPEPGSVTVPVQVEADDPPPRPAPPGPNAQAKLAGVRVWHLAKTNPPISLGFLAQTDGKTEDEDGAWLGRCLDYGSFGDFLPITSGRVKVIVFQDALADFDPNSRLSPRGVENRNVGTADFNAREDSFWTVIATAKNGRVEINLREEVAVDPSRRLLTGLNATELPALGIASVVGGRETPIFPSLNPFSWAGAPAELPTNPVFLRLIPPPNQDLPRLSAEPDFVTSRSSSAIIYTDRYGRISFRCIPGRPHDPLIFAEE